MFFLSGKNIPKYACEYTVSLKNFGYPQQIGFIKENKPIRYNIQLKFTFHILHRIKAMHSGHE